MKGLALLLSSFLCVQAVMAEPDPVPDPAVTAIWQNAERPTNERVSALLSQLTLKEKISLMYWLAPAIQRLGIKEYHHGDECLHGLVRPGKNTVFPQAIGLGATFDPDLIFKMADSISDEARGEWNQSADKHFGIFDYPLTLWSPVVNMARDPRWGRTQETYGEDPYLTSRLGVAFIEGLQGNDPHYLKVIATPNISLVITRRMDERVRISWPTNGICTSTSYFPSTLASKKASQDQSWPPTPP